MVTLLFLPVFALINGSMPIDSTPRQGGIQVHSGFIIPHSPDLKLLAQARPLSIDLTYSQIALSRNAYERCNCFARVGGYAGYTAFGNPAELGRAYGAGGFFEPIIHPQNRLYFSFRTTAGLVWLTRIYDAETNPRNTFFGASLSGLLALSVSAHYRLTNQLHLSAIGRYNHISNGGTRQPNRGMNFPTVGLGLLYTVNPIAFPNPGQWPRQTVSGLFTKRIMLFGSVRTLPKTATLPEQVGWSWGFTATAGYRISRFHALTGGVEFVNDGYLRQQLRRAGLVIRHQQVGVLGGHEAWLGRYRFATHLGWNLLQPGVLPGSHFFQRYQLLYTIRNQYQIGIGLRARLNVAEGFDVRAGMAF